MGLRLRFGAIGTIAFAGLALVAAAFLALILLALMPVASMSNFPLSSGASSPSSSGGVFTYNPFENPIAAVAFAISIILSSTIALARTYETKDAKIMALAAAGAFFITCSAFVALGAFSDMLSARASGSANPTIGAQFGWLIFAAACAAIGAAVSFVAEGIRSKSGTGRSIYAIIAHNLSILFTAYSVFIFVIGSSSTAYYLDTFMDGKPWFEGVVSSPVALLGWIGFWVISGYIGYRLLSYSQVMAPKHELSQFALHTPLSLAGTLFLLEGAALACISFCQLSVLAFPLPWEANSVSLLGIALAIFCNLFAFTLFNLLCAAKENLGVPKTGFIAPAIIGGAIAIPSLLVLTFSMFGAIYAIGEAGQGAITQMFLFSLLSFAYSCAILYFAYKQASKPYAPLHAQAGSILSYLYIDDSQPSNSQKGGLSQKAGASGDSEAQRLEARIVSLEKKVASLEKKKGARKS